MILNATDYPLLGSVDEAEKLLLMTMEEVDKEVVNQISIQHPLWEVYKENGWIEYRENIGPFIPVNIRSRENSTVKAHTGWDDVDWTPQPGIDKAVFQYGQLVGTQMYNREEMVKNYQSIVDIVDEMGEQLSESLLNYFSEKVMGTQDANGRDFMGFGRILQHNTAIGGIDPNQPGKGWWNPQQGLKPGGGQYSLATEMRAGQRALVRKCTYKKEAPAIWLMGEDLYDANQQYAEDKLRFTADDFKRGDQGAALEQFEMFKHNGRYYIYDESLDAKEGWLINPKRAPIRVHSGTNFTFMPWKDIPNKIGKGRECLLYCGIFCKRRDVHGKIKFQ